MDGSNELLSIKKELKCWESLFARKYGRRPTKEDIDGSAAEIKESYKRYSYLRQKKVETETCTVHNDTSKTTEEDSNEIDDSVFGKSLNKKSTKSPVKKVKYIKMDPEVSWRPKLKPVKRLTTAGDKNKNQDGNKNNEDSENKIINEEESFPVMNFEITTANKTATSKGSGKKLFNGRSRVPSSFGRLTNMPDEWLDNYKKCLETEADGANRKVKTETFLGKGEHEHPDDNCATLCSNCSPEKTSSTIEEHKNIPHIEVIEKRDVGNQDKEFLGEMNEKRENHQTPRVYTVTELCMNQHILDTGCILKESKVNGCIKQTEIPVKTKPSSTTVTKSIDDDMKCSIDAAVMEKNSEVSGNMSDTSNKDNEIDVVTASKRNTKKRNKLKDENVGEEEMKTVKGKRKREKENKEDDQDGKESKKVKLSKKAAAKSKRLVSDNFVKIDLRKKTYVRGVNKMTGSAYKRKMWKKKTSFEQPTKYGKGNKKNCFKCGGEGHWAKFCRGPPKKIDPFSKLDEEKQSLEFQHLSEMKGSCFDYLNVDEASVNIEEKPSRNKFSIEDVMDIEPTWPRNVHLIEDDQSNMEPLFESENGKPCSESYKKVKNVLKSFGFDTFREGQHEAISRIVCGLSTLVILSTGSGKSLCYQLPAYLYFKENKWITIVVSPLVALMQDQVAGLPSCLPGACLNSNMTKLQQQRVVAKLKDGKIAVLLVSPEALVSGGFGTGILPPKSNLPPIAFACIDEAHCLSEWSHNFRPSYLKVCKVLRERYNIQCLLGLTATASQTTAKSVIHHLGIPSEGSIIRDPNPIPDNLRITASRDEQRDVALVELLQCKPFSECESVIVYVTRRVEADRLAVLLRTSLPDFTLKTNEKDKEEKGGKKKIGKGKSRKSTKPFWWNVECYHAGLTPAQRRRVQNEFMSGDLRIVVATVAFGMGLDKSDVRSVIHYNMPKSFENYVQEIGRAGRDGIPSFCHVFIDDDGIDLNELRRHIYGNTIDRSTVNKFIDLVFPSCTCAELSKKYMKTNEDISLVQKNYSQDDDCDRQSLSDSDLEMFFSKELDDEINVECVESDVKISDSVKGNSHYIENESECPDEIHRKHETNREDKNSFDVKLPRNDYTNSRTDSSDIEDNKKVLNSDNNYCSGHRRALPIDSTILELDMPEENISTLLSYLELHAKRWLELFNPIRSGCSVKCYGGPEQFQLLAKRFPPIAVAVKRLRNEDLRSLHEMRQIDFDLVEIADVMCWDVIIVAREVRSLQWNMTFALDAPLNSSGKSGIIVECEQLSFHAITAGGIGDDQKDNICDFLNESIVKQEETRVLQLNALYNVLKDLSCQHYWQLQSNKRVDEKARADISRYFLCDEEGQLKILKEMCTSDTSICTPARRWNVIAGDIRNLLISHPDEDFNGRAVARIFQGISSPCYPALTYGRDRRFWRQYLDVDFNELRKFAVQEIRHFRS